MADLQKTRKQKDKTELQPNGENDHVLAKDKEESMETDVKTFKTPNKEQKR